MSTYIQQLLHIFVLYPSPATTVDNTTYAIINSQTPRRHVALWQQQQSRRRFENYDCLAEEKKKRRRMMAELVQYSVLCTTHNTYMHVLIVQFATFHCTVIGHISLRTQKCSFRIIRCDCCFCSQIFEYCTTAQSTILFKSGLQARCLNISRYQRRTRKELSVTNWQQQMYLVHRSQITMVKFFFPIRFLFSCGFQVVNNCR